MLRAICLRESWMRETRTSGLTRERAPNGPSLLYISVLIFEQWHEETSSFRSRADPLPGYAQERRSEIMALGRRPDFHLSECQLVIESRTEITEPRRAFQPLINRLMPPQTDLPGRPIRPVANPCAAVVPRQYRRDDYGSEPSR
jgi:hypothetical protein